VQHVSATRLTREDATPKSFKTTRRNRRLGRSVRFLRWPRFVMKNSARDTEMSRDIIYSGGDAPDFVAQRGKIFAVDGDARSGGVRLW
jgi:hypothetical protein